MPLRSAVGSRLGFVALGGLAAGVILAFSIVGAGNFDSGSMGAGQDARGYWQALRDQHPYGPGAGIFGAYLYSPAFMQGLSPILSLPWQQFLAVWTVVLMAALLVLTGPVIFVLALPVAFFEIWGGNVHLLMALAIVAGFRWPASWAFVLLTKVTPGVGLTWFLVRREWRALAVAGAATGALVGMSWVIEPGLWISWLNLLLRESNDPPPAGSIAIPLLIRLPSAVGLIAFAAMTSRKWLVPVGVLLALPVLWWGSLSLLTASLAIERERIERRVLDLIERLRTAGDRPARTAPSRRWVTEQEA